jgi:hypothetical protein
MKGGEIKPMRVNEIAEADVKPAEERVPQRQEYKEWEDPDLNYMVHFSNSFNAKYEA